MELKDQITTIKNETADRANTALRIGTVLEEMVSDYSAQAGYIGLLSGAYFDGSATSVDIPVEQVDVWQDVVMTVQAPSNGVHLGGVVDQRFLSMKEANSAGYLGTGAEGDPLVFLLEGIETNSSCTFKTSLTFEPDEDGGRLDSRILFNKNSGAVFPEDFPIDAAGLAMESGADEEYPQIVNVQFFIGNASDIVRVGNASKFRFQVKSDVAGTVSMNKMALFIQL